MNLLAADIGGTKTILGIFRWDGSLKTLFKKKYISRDWDSFDLIISDFIKSLPIGIELPSYGCLAVAGRVLNDYCKITNLKWELKSQDICQSTGLKLIELINDFSVLVYGINHLQESQYEIIQGDINKKECDTNGLIAIIGAGTGLGVARGLISDNSIKILPSEGGHKEFAPRSNKEWELLNWLKQDLHLERLSLERIVSGTGLGHIARWLLMQPESISHPLRVIAENFNKDDPPLLDMASIASEFAKNGDKLMKEALEIWLNAYGSAAGDFALQELCYKGLWIGGGSSGKNIPGLKSATFLQAFTEKGRFKSFLEKIPVFAFKDPEIGLFSAGCRAYLLSNEMGDLS